MFTRANLFTLLDASPACGVSIFMPTHLMGAEIRQGPIRLKNLTGEAIEKLQEMQIAPTKAQELLAPAVALIDDYGFWQHQAQGLALFLGDGDMRVFKLPVAPPELVSTGSDFHVRPLLPLLSADGAFRVLTITADDVKLFRASRFAMAEEDSSALPRNLDEVKGLADHENSQMASPISRPHTGSIDIRNAQSQGESAEDWRKSRRVEYIQRIALAMKEILSSEPMPLVLAGDAETIGHFQKTGALGHELAGTIEINPDVLDDQQLHEAAYAVLRPRFDQERADAIDSFAALHGKGDPRAAHSIDDVSKAAQEGRIETMFVAEGVTVGRRSGDTGSQGLKTDHPPGRGHDLLDRLVAQTLKTGGRVYVMAAEDMPLEEPALAILRY